MAGITEQLKKKNKATASSLPYYNQKSVNSDSIFFSQKFRQNNCCKKSKKEIDLTKNIVRSSLFLYMHYVTHTVWKNEKFSLTEKKFRQISYLVISLVKPLLSRNVCQKSVRDNFCNFHNVQAK